MWTGGFFSKSLRWAVKRMWARRTLTSYLYHQQTHNLLQSSEIAGNYNYMPKRTGGWPAQQQRCCSGGATAAGKCFVMEHLELCREQSQKQRDPAASLCQHRQQQLWCGQALQAAQWWPWLSTLVWCWCHSWSLLVHRHTELSKYVV